MLTFYSFITFHKRRLSSGGKKTCLEVSLTKCVRYFLNKQQTKTFDLYCYIVNLIHTDVLDIGSYNVLNNSIYFLSVPNKISTKQVHFIMVQLDK